MKYWINQLKLSSLKAKVFYLCVFLFQAGGVYFYFSGLSSQPNSITWNEIFYSFLLIIPWILPLVLYLNFKLLPITNLFYWIRCTFLQRWKVSLQVIGMNILLNSILTYLIGLFFFFTCHSLLETFQMAFFLILRWGFFLFNTSLLQSILMLVWKNKGILTALLYFTFLMMSYTSSPLCATFLFSPLFPAQFTLFSLILALGYLGILLTIYIHLEEQRELL